MIKIIKVKDPFQRWSVLSDFNSSEECLIVSDIKTKRTIENHLLDKKNHLENHSVLRIYEFFEEIFYDIKSEWSLVSDSFLAQSFLEFTANDSNLWTKNLKNSKILLNYLEQFLPLLFHPRNSELLEEWFEDRSKTANLRWKHWYFLCRSFFEKMQSKKMIHQSGLKSFLMNRLSNTEDTFFSKKRLKVDLGVSIDSCDLFILKEFSCKRDVIFFVPDREEKEFYGSSIDVYKKLLEEVPPSFIETNPFIKKQQTLFFKEKNVSQLEEVKKATVQVRQWLNQGVKESDIVLLSPRIESYWFALQIHLEKENIKVRKESTAQASDFSYMKYWLASLNLHLGFVDFSKLETYSFYKNPKESFSDFYSMYLKNSNEKKSMKILKQFDKKRNPNEKVKGREFINWAVSFLPKEDDSILDFIFQVFQPFLLEEELKWVSWLKFLESEIFSQNKTILEEHSYGISCLSFNAIHSIKGKYVFIMGLDEDSLQTHFSTNVTQKDREELVSDLGFILPYPHPKEKEYSLLWFLQSSQLKEVIFSFSFTDFSGEVLTPSLFYILSDNLFKIEKSKNLDLNLTHWDSYKKQIKTLSDRSLKNFNLIQYKKNVFKDREHPYFQRGNIKLSNKRLKTFSDCPFKYAVNYLFHIKDLDVIDREISPLDVGLLVHKLFEHILSTGTLDFSEEEIQNILERIKPEEKRIVNEKQWEIIQKFLMELAFEFLYNEKKKRNDLPAIKPLGLEKEVLAYWNKEKSELDLKGKYPFTGKVDRIDYDEENQTYLLIDYKSSSDSLTHIKSWISDKKDDFQLLLYAQALEKGLIENLESRKVSALFYYAYKNFSYKGYVEKGKAPYKIFEKSRFQFDRSVLEKSFQEANKKIQKYIDFIEKGNFFPKPKNETICENCSWRKWCRASHLN